MSQDADISKHYSHGNLTTVINDALGKLGISHDDITADDLAPVDEFHIGGRIASEHFFDQVDFKRNNDILDIGCGIGGASRFVSSKFDCDVTGIDITKEFIETGNTLSYWCGLDNQVSLEHGSALEMPYSDDSFEGAFMMHVGMNIADKSTLFREAYRVITPGSTFAIYDIMKISDDPLTYPVPWATDDDTSYLASVNEYKAALLDAGFKISHENDRKQFGIDFFNMMMEKNKEAGGPPILGLHIILGDTAPEKIKNLIHNLNEGRIAPTELFVTK